MRQLQGGKIGLVGEQIGWDSSWRFLKDYSGSYRQSWVTLPDNRRIDLASYYMDFLERNGTPHGPKGDHLQSLVLCTTRPSWKP